jgi:hypothetical protein
MKNKGGHIVSKSKHISAKKNNRLVKAGFLTKKGHFGFIKKGKKSRKMRGGMSALSPSTIKGIHSTSGVNLQFLAGNAN